MAGDGNSPRGKQGIVSASREELAARFSELADETLLERIRSDALTEEAKAVAQRELRSRGVEFSEPSPSDDTSSGAGEDAESIGDLVTLVVNLVPTEAHILQARLDAEGIFATVADTHLGQVGWAIPAAAGGARVLVAERHVERAKVVLAQLQRGDFRLDEHDEPVACPRCAGTKLTSFIPGFLASVFKYSGPAQRLRCDSCGHTWPNSTSSL
jgi:Putative prokaryotic signal transducing protein